VSLFSFELEKLGNSNFVYGIMVYYVLKIFNYFQPAGQKNVFGRFIQLYPTRVEQW